MPYYKEERVSRYVDEKCEKERIHLEIEKTALLEEISLDKNQGYYC